MGAIKRDSRRRASRSRVNFTGKRPGNAPLARIVSRAPASRVGERFYTPKDASLALAAVEITLCAHTIRARCNLPASDPRHIATNPAYPGRHYIPGSEIARLMGVEAAA